MEWYIPVDVSSDVAAGQHRRLYRVDLAAAAGDVTVTLTDGATPNGTAHYVGVVIKGDPSGRQVVVRRSGDGSPVIGQLLFQGQAAWFAWNGDNWDVVAEAGPEYGPAVPNIAALADIDDELLQAGARVRVLSVLDDFELLPTSGLPDTPMLVVATQSGNGKWVRCLQGDAGAWLAESEWRVDVNTGDDENAGRNASPLASWAELNRRFGGATAYHETSKVIRVTALGASDPLDFNWGTAPSALVNVIGDLTTSFAGAVVAKTDLSEVAPGTANAVTAAWTIAEVGLLARDVTNNRWCFPGFDLGAVGSDRNLECSPWANIDTTNGSATITTGNSTVAATLETYTLPTVAATSNLNVIGSRTGQVIGVLVQQLRFDGQHSNFSGMKLCVQNCRLASVRFQRGPVILNNTYNVNGAPFEASEAASSVTLSAGVWASGMANNNNGQGCLFDVRSNALFLGQLYMNRRGIARLRNVFFMRMGSAPPIVFRDGSLGYMTSTSSVCGTGHTASNFFCTDTSGVQIQSGSAVAVCKLSNGGLPILLGGLSTCNAFDPATGLYSLPRNLTYALIDATFAAGGFGGAAFDPKFGTFFQVNPVAP